jgi:F-type H+-transporting ATPase subunit delta
LRALGGRVTKRRRPAGVTWPAGFCFDTDRSKQRVSGGAGLAEACRPLGRSFRLWGPSSLASESSGLSGVAERYATALYDLADESKALDAVAEDLRTIKNLISGSPELRRFLRSPLINRQDQTKGIQAVLAASKTGDLVRRFVGVVGGNRRLFALPGIIDAFLRHLAKRRGEVTVHVSSARPLSAEQSAQLTDALKKSVGQKINIESKVEPELIGGLVVRVGSRMVDTSIRSQLQKLRRALRAA